MVRLAAAVVIALYAILGLVALAPESVYSGDIGVKYVQARALVNQRFTSLDIRYPGEFLDPAREFFPLRPPFVMATGGTTQAIFPPTSAVLQAIAVAAGGFRGLIVLSILSAAVILLASVNLSPVKYRLAVVVAVGLGGPLWFYAVSGSEHAPAVAFGTAAFAWAVRAPAAPWIAGALLGSGATLRDEVILLAPGLLLTLWCRERGWRRIGTAMAGMLVPLAIAAAVEVWWFERPAAAHLRHAVHLLQTALRVTEQPNPDVPVLRPMTPRERYDTVFVYWTFGRGTDAQVAGFVTALVAALLVRWRWRSSIGILLWLLAFGVTTAGDVWEVLTAPKWLAGLIRVCPFVVFSILPLAAVRQGAASGSSGLPGARDGERWLPLVFALTACSYLLIAFAGVDTTGGKSLGPRLLLPLIPLLSVSALMIMASYLASPAVLDRAVGGIGVALAAAAVAIHLGGTIPAYRQRNADDAAAVLAAAASSERVIVADDMFTAQLLFPLYHRKVVFLADTVDSGKRLGALLASQRLGAVLVSRQPEPVVSLLPLRLQRSDIRGRMVLQQWTR